MEILTLDVAEVETVNPFKDDLAQLVEVTDNAPEGKEIRGKFVVPLSEKSKARTLIGKAANSLGKTARFKSAEEVIDADNADNSTVEFTITLTKLNAKAGKVIGPRVKQDEAPAETSAEGEAEAPAEAEAEVTETSPEGEAVSPRKRR